MGLCKRDNVLCDPLHKKPQTPFWGIAVEPTCMADESTEIGKIAHSEWYKTIELRPDMNLELGEFVVMPNHIHGIIIIGKNQYNGKSAMHSGSMDRLASAVSPTYYPEYGSIPHDFKLYR